MRELILTKHTSLRETSCGPKPGGVSKSSTSQEELDYMRLEYAARRFLGGSVLV